MSFAKLQKLSLKFKIKLAQETGSESKKKIPFTILNQLSNLLDLIHKALTAKTKDQAAQYIDIEKIPKEYSTPTGETIDLMRSNSYIRSINNNIYHLLSYRYDHILNLYNKLIDDKPVTKADFQDTRIHGDNLKYLKNGEGWIKFIENVLLNVPYDHKL